MMNFITCLPLPQVSSPTRAVEVIAAEEERIDGERERLATARPGLLDAYNLQLKRMKDNRLPATEFITGPFFYSTKTGAFVRQVNSQPANLTSRLCR